MRTMRISTNPHITKRIGAEICSYSFLYQSKKKINVNLDGIVGLDIAGRSADLHAAVD